MMSDVKVKVVNPITALDYPDADVIRVGEVYYMVSTTMHFMPGCEILRSYDLANWEHAAYVYDRLDSTPGQRLEGTENIYGKGMWAASLRFHQGLFYVCFVANDTRKTYLFTAETIEGPWEKRYIDGFYHDASLLFDDDGKIYIAYGNRDIYITQLKPDLSGPLEGGLHRLAVSDAGNPYLGYEGTHFYKINGKYYLFMIHSRRDRWMRTESCFMADTPEGEFTGGDVLEDDRGYCGQGVAQGGIVDTPEGLWYGILFQDSGAVGRIPVLIPVTWEGDRPVFGEKGRIPRDFSVSSLRPGYVYEPLVQSDDFRGEEESELSGEDRKRRCGCFGLKSAWQFNHEPDLNLVRRDREAGKLWLTTDKLCHALTEAPNILTQRMSYPFCAGEVTVDAGGLNEGDYAGICALQGCYAMAALTKRQGQYYLVMRGLEIRPGENRPGSREIYAGREWDVETKRQVVRLKLEADFTGMRDEVRFYYLEREEWKQLGEVHKLYFRLDHFTGCRIGLFAYATEVKGGRAGFSDFVYRRGAADVGKHFRKN